MEQKTVADLTLQMSHVTRKIIELTLKTVNILKQDNYYLHIDIIKRNKAAIKGLYDFHDKLKFKRNQIKNSHELYRAI